jgi:acetylornithine deacetylase
LREARGRHVKNPQVDVVLQAVEQRNQEIIRFLQELIRIGSETGTEGQIQTFLAKYLQKQGLRVDMWDIDLERLKNHQAFLPVPGNEFAGRPDVVAVWQGRGGGKSLLLNGHVDTITPGPQEEWDYGPLSGHIDKGRIYGRGASDMKGGLAAMTMAVVVLKALGYRPGGDVILEYVVDEEVTGYGTLSAIERGYKADAGICCETSNLEVQPACIGRLWFSIDIRGKSSSISNRWESVSAIEKGIKIVQAVEDLERIRIQDLKHPLYPDNRGALPCAICMFNAGSFPSATPDRAVLRGSMGLMPYEEVRLVEQGFRQHIRHICQADPWLRNHPPDITFKDLGADGAEIPADSPIVQVTKAAFEEASGKDAVISGRRGGSDTRYLIKYGDTPTVIFGPGHTDQMHATNEFVTIDNLIVAVKALALAIITWCG